MLCENSYHIKNGDAIANVFSTHLKALVFVYEIDNAEDHVHMVIWLDI